MGTLSTSLRSEWLDTRVIAGKSLSFMDHLYNRMDGMYPNRWRAAFGGDSSAMTNWREAWADAFAEEGITPQQVGDAVRACRKRFDWPPSLPEFLKLCCPPADHEGAFREAMEQMHKRESGEDKWSHPAIYWAAVEYGTWELRQASWDRARARWTRLLDEKLAQRDLPAVPDPMVALPAPGKTSVDPEKVKQMLAELRERMAQKA